MVARIGGEGRKENAKTENRLSGFSKQGHPPPFFSLLPALLLWLFVSGSRSCQSGSLSSFQTSPALLLVPLNDFFQVFVAVAFDPVQIVTVQPANIVTIQGFSSLHVAADII